MPLKEANAIHEGQQIKAHKYQGRLESYMYEFANVCIHFHSNSYAQKDHLAWDFKGWGHRAAATSPVLLLLLMIIRQMSSTQRKPYFLWHIISDLWHFMTVYSHAQWWSPGVTVVIAPHWLPPIPASCLVNSPGRSAIISGQTVVTTWDSKFTYNLQLGMC